MNILFATSELTPLAKTGGLGDVAAALPAELRRAGHSVSIVLPAYREVREALPHMEDTGLGLTIPLGRAQVVARIYEAATREGVKLFLVRRDEFFDRGGFYGNEEGDYTDNAARFIFFAKAAAELASRIRPRPEVLHLNDWQTAFAASWVRHRRLPLATVLTIHNLAYQGVFAPWDHELTNLPDGDFNPREFEFYGHLNLLKAGLVHADRLTTVSPSYAREIQGEAMGCGLDGVLRGRADALTGILNGIDTGGWDPAADPHLEHPFSAGRMAGKKKNRAALLERFGLEAGPKAPVFACISRLVPQKGLDLVAELAPEIVSRGGCLVLLGSGQKELEDAFAALAAAHPRQVGVRIGFDEPLAHLIEAGADFFLMPSRFEPCGLNQMYSQRYGTVPVVTATGGLADSVQDWDPARDAGTGLVAPRATREDLAAQVVRAFGLMHRPAALAGLRKRGMAADFSWSAAARAYETVYQQALGVPPCHESTP